MFKKAILISALTIFTFTNCSDENETIETEIEKELEYNLEGKWKVFAFEIIENEEVITEEFTPGECGYQHFIFNNENKFSIENPWFNEESNLCENEYVNGNWVFETETKNVNIVINGNNTIETLKLNIVEFSENEMKLEILEDKYEEIEEEENDEILNTKIDPKTIREFVILKK